MLNILKEQIKDNHILILGYGRDGHSTLHRILEVGGFASVTVADKNQVQLPDSVKALCGEHYMDTLDDYDLIFKSPGVVLPKDPEQYSCRFTSQMEVFFEAYRDRIIVITGTKGKSTNTTLLYFTHCMTRNHRIKRPETYTTITSCCQHIRWGIYS